jgi:hypothetical protein
MLKFTTERKGDARRQRRKCEDNIKIGTKEMNNESVERIFLAVWSYKESPNSIKTIKLID